MWSDTLLAAERAHLVQAILWAAASIVLGTSVIAFVTLRRAIAPIIYWFGIQSLLWGAIQLIVAYVRWRSLAMRDVSAATRLDRFTWFSAGFDTCLVAAGVMVIGFAWMHGRRLGALGGGLGILVQGLGMLVINLTFASLLARLV